MNVLDVLLYGMAILESIGRLQYPAEELGIILDVVIVFTDILPGIVILGIFNMKLKNPQDVGPFTVFTMIR